MFYVALITSLLLGAFMGRTVAIIRMESKMDYFIANADSDIYIYNKPYHGVTEPLRVRIQKEDRIDVLKKVNFNKPGKGIITEDIVVKDEFDIKKYKLKKGDVFEAVRCSYKINHEDEKDFYIRLGNERDKYGNPQYSYVDYRHFKPFLSGKWWYIKTKDNKVGWYSPLSSDEKQLKSNSDKRLHTETESGFPIYLDNNSNYILINVENPYHAWYIDKDSIKCEDSSDCLTIGVKALYVHKNGKGETNIRKTTDYEFGFMEYKDFAGESSESTIPLSSFNYNGKDLKTLLTNSVAAMSYYIVTEKQWKKFNYDSKFYSRAIF